MHTQETLPSTDPLTSADLQRFVDQQGITAAILPLEAHTSTVEEAARALGVEPQRIIKSLVFKAADEPLLVINNGPARVDRRKLARLLGVGRKRVRFADPAQVLKITGYVVGSMPPFGHRRKLRTLVDPAVTALDTVYGGGGAIDAMMRLAPAELLRVTGAEVLDISE